MPRRTQHTFCRICESLCGLEAEIEGDQVVELRPDKSHVATSGFACIKGLKQHEMYSSPDRLTTPLKRMGDHHEPISWEQALSEIGAKVRSIRGRFAPESLAMYVGTAAGFSVLHPVFAQAFMQGLGSPSFYTTATQDCANKFAAATHMYGFPFVQPFPDVDRTECLIIVGANPAVSKWSFLQVANPVKRLKEIRARGGRVVVIDPRSTETADASSEHHFIRPNTDVFFYLSFLHELLSRQREGQAVIDLKRVEEVAEGFDELWKVASPWPPERSAEVTQIPARILRKLVDAYLAASGAALYSSTGVNMGTHGATCFWLQEVINCLSGNLDRAGGTLVGQGVFDFPRFGVDKGLFTGRQRSRVGGFRQINDAFPGGILADEILTPGDKQVRALFVTGGNPLITMPNSERLSRAFQDLELLVSVDLFLNETASLADYVLPATSPLERPDLPFVFPLFLGLQSRPYLQATEALIPPPGQARDEASIYLALARASGVSLWGSRAAQLSFEGLRDLKSAFRGAHKRRVPQEFLLNGILRLTRQPGFRRLLRSPHGVVIHPDREQSFLNERVVTPTGKVQLAPKELLATTGSLDEQFKEEKAGLGRFKLITKRAVTTHNSWTHNHPDFVAGRKSRNYLYMHPEDAAELEIRDGDAVDVSTSTATVRLLAQTLRTLMPGVVALPHGWGHQAARGLRVAAATEGVNVNLLAADGPDALEPTSGMAQLTGFFVDVRPAAGPVDTSNWSGLPRNASEHS